MFSMQLDDLQAWEPTSMNKALSVHTREGASGDEASLRDAVSARLSSGEIDRSIQFARLLLQERAGLRTLRFLRRLAESDHARAGMAPFRVALLSSFSIEFVHDALIAYGFINRLAVTVYNCGFGAFRQEMLDPGSGLYRSDPHLAVLAVEGQDWLPTVYGGDSALLLDAAGVEQGFSDEVSVLLTRFRANSSAPLLIHNLAPPNPTRLGILDTKYPNGQSRLVGKLNDELCQVCSRVADVHVLDYASLVARHGSSNWYDARMRLYARAPIAQPMLGDLAREYVKYCRALAGLSRKCLVLDLDNTLWGGVIGEEGLDGIELGANYPGSAFVEFQRGVRSLRDRGVLLAIASKNNPEDVEQVFEKHRFMVLKRDDFAEFEVHWEPKNESLSRIARKLNIGLDQMVFVDDDAAECERIRSALPMVTVVQLPSQPERYLDSLFEDGWFDSLSLSEEDRNRTALYRQRSEAEELRAASGDIEAYYRDLEMEVTFAPVTQKSLARAAQMTQKTNQFNATTRRYSDAELARRMADPDWVLVTVSVADRFGDNGIVGLIIGRMDGESIDIDTFLLSCRVIARTIETAMLTHLCKIAREREAKSIRGTIIHTPKNAPVRDLFEGHGFSREAEEGTGSSVWRLELDRRTIQLPAWIKVVEAATDRPH
jgi:FkbH-like protein